VPHRSTAATASAPAVNYWQFLNATNSSSFEFLTLHWIF
jgi:hypothetical protein